MSLAEQVSALEQIACAALEMNRLAKLAYSDRDAALDGLSNLVVPPEIAYLRDALIERMRQFYKAERKPRSR